MAGLATLAPEDTGPQPEMAAASAVRQFVSFGVAGELFAVPLTLVHEIIRYPDIVRVPLGAASLEGLGNLRGTVLPILSLRRLLGAPDVEHDDATRVVVLNADGRPVGLVVDRMANVVSAEPDRIESADAIRSAIATDLLTGVIKNRDGESMVMIIDAGMLIRREFTAVTELAEPAEAETSAQVAASGERERAEQATEIQLVSFAVAGQEYALPIEAVQEIVQIPPSITTVPNCSSHVLGVMTLRNRLLPLVSLRRMFNLPDVELSESNKIVVVTLGTGVSVGIVMDSVREVLRVSRSVIDAMPEMLNRAGDSGEITSICRLAGGTRLVSVLSAARLFDVDEIRQLQTATGTGTLEAEQTDDSSAHAAVADDEEQLVVFRVMQEEYAVPIESVQEIVRVPDELVRVPKTPDFIEGVVNLRGAVLPVLDQRRRFGLPPVERNDRQRIVVFSVKGLRTGFIVDSVSQVMRVPAHLIGSAPELSEEQRRLIRRVVNLADQKRMILMLEVDQLLNVGELSELVAAAA
jgi:purine-binding chemotaxis protein CheW